MLRNYYNDLGLEKTATQDEIKKAFRQLALKYHPDKNKSPLAEKKFTQINEAYQLLSNSEKRAMYDRAYKAQFTFFVPQQNKTQQTAQSKTYTKAQQKKANQKRQEKINYSTKTKKIAYFLHIASLFFVLIIFLDAFLPKEKQKLYSFKIELNDGLNIVNKNIHFPIANQRFIRSMQWLDSMEITKTKIFGTNFGIKGYLNPQIKHYNPMWQNTKLLEVSAKPSISIYRLFMFAPILLLLLSLLGTFRKKKTNYTVDILVAVILMDIYTVFFLFV